MKRTDRQLLALIRLALGGELQEVLHGDIDWQRLYSLAAEQSVLGLAFAGYQKLVEQVEFRSSAVQDGSRLNDIEREALNNFKPLPLEEMLQWYALTEQNKKRKAEQDKAVAGMAELLDMHGFDYVVFKGLAVASVYPEKLVDARAPGDVDFYIPAWDFGRAMKLFEDEWGVVIKKDEIDKHFSFQKDGVPYEMHYQMETFGCAKYQKRFGEMEDNYLRNGEKSWFEVDGKQVVKLSAELDMMLVMKHWMTHLIGEGVGLRQTTDMAAQVLKYRDVVDAGQLQRLLDSIGYRKAFGAVVALVDKYFGVEWKDYCVGKSDYRNADRLMATIIRNGNFGRSDYHYTEGRMKRLETTWRFFKHCFRFMALARWDILCVMPKRVMISLKAHGL